MRNLTEEDAAFALAVAEEILNFVEEVISST
jgi:HEPN domain-containing protein